MQQSRKEEQKLQLSDTSKQSNILNSQKQKRRTRNDQSQRQYTCGCGKSYLSYPALYTHQKQKHAGNPPIGTQMPQINGKSNQQQLRIIEAAHAHVSQQLQIFSIFSKKIEKIQNANQQQDYSAISELVSYLNQLQVKLCLTDAFVSINQGDIAHSIQNFPKPYFENNDINYEKILLQLYEISGSYISSLQSVEAKQASCNKIFASFLNQCSTRVTTKAYIEICVFIGIYRLIANDLGWQVKKTYETELLEKLDIPVKAAIQEMIMQQEFHYLPEFCDNNFADILPELANQVVEKFNQQFQKFRNGEFVILGFKYENIKNIIFFVQFFCNWLFENGFSNTKIELTLDTNDKQYKKLNKLNSESAIKQENIQNDESLG